MNRLASACLILLIAGILTSCSTVTLRPEGTAKLGSEPTWSQSNNYFLWGLIGDHRVDTERVCGERGVRQMQAQDTFVDGLLALITLGIYAPRTSKVWCN